MPFRFSRPLASVLLVLAGVLLFMMASGCDAGDDDAGVAPATVQFGVAELSALEAETPTVELPVTISNAPGSEVTVEVLFAAGASEGLSLADLGISEIDDARAFYGEDDSLNAYVAETVTFPAGATDGDTLVASFDIGDDEVEAQEAGLFALQRATSAGGERVAIGEPANLTLVVEAEGTQTLVSADFGGGELAPFTAVSVASGADWSTASDGDAPNVPYAAINGFGADEPSNDWLISPALDFTGTQAETLTFLNAKNFDDEGLDGRALRVLVSTDYSGTGDPTAATWTDVSDRVANYSEGEYNFVSSGEVDLSDEAFQSEATHVAFQYVSSGTGPGSSEAWQVDDIVVTGRGGGGGNGGGDDDGNGGD